LEDEVAKLIKAGVDLDAPGSRFGGTALHGAVLRLHAPVMRLILDAGADPSRADYNQVTPLHTAAAFGNVEVISLLLQFRASKDAVDGMGETPHVWAVNAGQEISQKLLLGLEVEETDQPKSVKQEVWKRSVPYFPDFYGRRSGLNSSIILKVEIGSRLLAIE
jgi:ankyrin repeat protein